MAFSIKKVIYRLLLFWWGFAQNHIRADWRNYWCYCWHISVLRWSMLFHQVQDRRLTWKWEEEEKRKFYQFYIVFICNFQNTYKCIFHVLKIFFPYRYKLRGLWGFTFRYIFYTDTNLYPGYKLAHLSKS